MTPAQVAILSRLMRAPVVYIQFTNQEWPAVMSLLDAKLAVWPYEPEWSSLISITEAGMAALTREAADAA